MPLANPFSPALRGYSLVGGGTGRRPLPPPRLLALTGGVFFFVAVLFLHAKHGHEHASARLPGWLPSSLTDHCDPYARNGFLNFNPKNAHENRWTPYVSASPSAPDACTPPLLGASFVKAAWDARAPSRKSILGDRAFASKPAAPDGRNWIDMEWARGRTVLVMGDSITRFMTDYFCQMAGEAYIEVTTNHTWAPPPITTMPPPVPESERVPENLTLAVPDADIDVDAGAPSHPHPHDHRRRSSPQKAPEPHADAPAGQQDWSQVHPGTPKSHFPHYCYVPGMDFLVLHVMFFGLDQEQFWIAKERNNPPYTYEDRLEQIALPILDKIRETTGRTASTPELTYVHSGMWDIARFVREDLTAKKNVEENLSTGRLLWYRTRARQIMVATAQKLPRSTMKWLSTHYPLRVSAGWFFEGQKPEIKLNRLVELHEAAVSAIEDTEDASAEETKELERFSVNPWGLLMRGTEKYQVDDLHPSFLPGGYLWADMMLYDLQKAVGRAWRPRWWMLGA